MKITLAAAWPTVKRGRFALACWVGTFDTRQGMYRSITAIGRPRQAFTTAVQAIRTNIWL